MSEKILSRIFDSYFTTKGIAKGTGLGLSGVHGIVKNYKGDIRVNSTPAVGTEFSIFFPVAVEKDKEEPRHIKQAQPKGHGRILLVDDEPHTLKIEEQMLTRLGYEVISIESPLEAYKLFSERPARDQRAYHIIYPW